MLRDLQRIVMQLLYLVLAVLIFLDCVGSLIVGESFDNTLSAKAYDAWVNGQPNWKWTMHAINRMFFWQKDFWGERNHCHRCWMTEKQHGSVWKAWSVEFEAL